MRSLRDQVRDVIEQVMRPLRNRVYTMIARAVVESVKDDKGMQLVKLSVLAGEERDKIERFQNYGVTSKPKPGAEAIIVCPQGNREHMVTIIVDDRRYRLKGLEDGEVALYTDEGDYVWIKRGGNMHCKASTKVHLDTPAVELGAAAAEAVIKGNTFQSLFNNHVHVSNAPGNNTSPPVTPLDGSELSEVSKTE